MLQVRTSIIREDVGFGGAFLAGRSMEEAIRNLYVQSLRAKLELSRIVAATLMKDLESPMLTVYEKRAGFRRWLSVTHDGDVLAFVLDLLRDESGAARLGTALDSLIAISVSNRTKCR